MLVDKRTEVGLDVVGGAVEALARDDPRDAREHTDDDDQQHVGVQRAMVRGEGVVDVATEHVGHEDLEHQTHEGEPDREGERDAVGLDDGQDATPPGERPVPRDLMTRTAVLRANAA